MTTQYTSAREALARDLESAKAALKGAQEEYEKADASVIAALKVRERAYEGRARNSSNVDRITKAIAILDGSDDK